MRMTFRFAMAAALLFGIISSTSGARASEATDLLKSTGPGQATDTLPDSRNGGSSDSGHSSSLSTIAQINASSSNGQATLKIARSDSYGHSRPAKAGGGTEVSTRTVTWSLVLSAPLNKSDPDAPTTILASGGLPSDFSAKFGFSVFDGWLTTNRDAMNAIGMRALNICKDKLSTAEKAQSDAQADFERANGELDAKKAALDQAEDRYATLKTLCDNGGGDYDTLVKADVLELSQAERDAFKNAKMSSNAGGLVWGGDATIGYSKFDYFDMVTAAKLSSTGTPWSAHAYAGWLPSRDALLVLAGLAYQDSFKASATGTLCPAPAPVPPVLQCVTGAIGAPKETKSLVTSLELRRELALPDAFKSVGLSELGIDAKFAYDTTTDIYSFDLPLSFAMDDKKNLVGGVDFGWQSDKHDFVVGLFFSSAFSLLPG
jgi:hypothetical protein